MRRQSGLINRQGGVAGLVNEYTGHDMIFPGHLNYTAASAAPPGWLAANGAAISRAVYASLFAAIGTTYGAGDGSTTFNLPDLRGEFLRGWDNGRGVDSGRVRGSAQSHSTEQHKHEAPTPVSGSNVRGLDVAPWGQGSTLFSAREYNATTAGCQAVGGYTNPAFVQNGVGETRPRNVAQLAIIKY